MAQVDVRTRGGGNAGTVELDDNIFGIEPHVAVLHQVVTAQLAAARSGSHSTLTRAEVRGGGAKPYRQKGTGRARQGSIRSPQFRGGGIAAGPKPRDYRQRTPKKMVRLALRSALSDRAADGRIVVIDEWGFDTPSTKNARQALEVLGLEGRVLVVIEPDDHAAGKSFRNLPHVHLIEPGELNAYDILCSDWVVFTRAALPTTAAVPGPAVGATAQPPVTKQEAEAPVAEPVQPPATKEEPAAPPPEAPAAEAPAAEPPAAEEGASQ